MSYSCNQSTPSGPCRRPVSRPGAPCGVDHKAKAAKVAVGARSGAPTGPPAAAAATQTHEDQPTAAQLRAFEQELAKRLAEVPAQEPSPKILELRRLNDSHDQTPAETSDEFDQKNRYQHNPTGDGRDVWTYRSGMLVKVKRAETASEADNAKLRNDFVAARPVTAGFRPGNNPGLSTHTDLHHAMQRLDRAKPAEDARYARLNLQALRNELAQANVDDDYIGIAESDQDNYGTLVVDDDRYGWGGEKEGVGGTVDSYLIALDNQNRAQWDRYVERNERGDPVRLRARFLRDQTTVLHDGDLGNERWDG